MLTSGSKQHKEKGCLIRNKWKLSVGCPVIIINARISSAVNMWSFVPEEWGVALFHIHVVIAVSSSTVVIVIDSTIYFLHTAMAG